MRKLIMTVMALSLMSGLYALRLGLGVAYEDVIEDARYLAVKADARFPLIPLIDVRGGILNVMLPDGGKAVSFATFTETDLLLKIPVPAAFMPYIALGASYYMSLEDNGPMNIGLKAGLGGEMGLGGFAGYLEFGVNRFGWSKVGDVSTTVKPLYAQLGVTVPIGL